MLACGHGFADSAFVIQWHLSGMFAPSFATGRLVARLGAERGTAAGLLLPGVGWNLLFVARTTLLTACHTAAEKAKVQGFHDFLLFSAVGFSASLSGVLHHAAGWTAMNLIALPALLAVGAMLLAAGRRGTMTAAAAGG